MESHCLSFIPSTSFIVKYVSELKETHQSNELTIHLKEKLLFASVGC